MITMITSNLLWTQGIPILIVFAVLAVIGYWLCKPLLYITFALFLFSLYFFRLPERTCPEALVDQKVLVCPADGTIVDLAYDESASYHGYTQKVSIFLSPLDVHAQWVPMAGTIEKIQYTAGSFMPAFLPKSSEQNEHCDIVIKNDNSNTIMVRQIAGIVARRICWWIDVGQTVKPCEVYGMIRFGSRVDIYLPTNVELLVGIGQRVYGGQTVLGTWQ